MKKTITISIIFSVIVGVAFSQMGKGGTPYTFRHEGYSIIHEVTMPDVDVEALLLEDSQADEFTPFRFGMEIPVNLDMENTGSWVTTSGGGKLWQLSISSSEAYSISLLFDDFFIPSGGELFIYNSDQSMVIGAFTYLDNKDDRKFATQPVPGNMLTLEYYEPEGAESDVSLHIKGVVHAYKNIFSQENNNERTGWCHNNVVCPEGDPWQEQIRSVTRLTMSGYLCSGSLINNTANDQTQYYLTAFHCIDGSGSPSYFTFNFNYQASTCNGGSGPLSYWVQGSVLRASSEDIYNSPDFALLQITSPIPDSYEPYYSGWDRSTSYPQQPVGIHHPDADIKKISFDDDQATHYNYYKWNVSWDDGVTEPGSSGSPLFDSDHRIVGDLSTGCSNCDDQYCSDQYGKLYRSWDYGSTPETRLRDWLDPLGLDVDFIDGLDPFNQNIVLYGDLNEDEIINIQDIILEINIVVGNYVPSEYQVEAGDLNEDGIINVLDIIQIVNIILGDSNLSRGDNLESADIIIDDHMVRLQNVYGSVAGIQLMTHGEWNIVSDHLPVGWQIHKGENTLIVFSPSGEWFSGNTPLFEYNGEITIEDVIIGDYNGNSINVTPTETIIPEGISLYPAYPNPFNPVTSLKYTLMEDTFVSLSVYDVNGKLMKELVNTHQSAGYHTTLWDAQDEASGLYFMKFIAGDYQQTQKVMLVK